MAFEIVSLSILRIVCSLTIHVTIHPVAMQMLGHSSVRTVMGCETKRAGSYGLEARRADKNGPGVRRIGGCGFG